jgi:DNA-binding CsgD family transcriptional regulator
VRQFSVLGISSQGTITALSETSPAVAAAGLKREDVVGMRVEDFVRGEHVAAFRRRIGEAILAGTVQKFPITSHAPNGDEERWLTTLLRTAEPTVLIAVSVNVSPGPKVGKAERALLKQLSDDWTFEQIAKATKAKLGAVHARVARLRKKFGVETTHGLVCKAMQAGAIDC